MALNLEVVRGRAARSDAATLGPFADAAADELQRAVRLMDAFLALARPGCAPVDLWMVIEPVVRLEEAVLGAEHRSLAIVPPERPLPPVPCAPEVVRLACLVALNAFATSAALGCTARSVDAAAELEVSGDAEPLALPGAPRAALRRAGIRLTRSARAVTARFPAGTRHRPA